MVPSSNSLARTSVCLFLELTKAPSSREICQRAGKHTFFAKRVCSEPSSQEMPSRGLVVINLGAIGGDFMESWHDGNTLKFLPPDCVLFRHLALAFTLGRPRPLALCCPARIHLRVRSGFHPFSSVRNFRNFRFPGWINGF